MQTNHICSKYGRDSFCSECVHGTSHDLNYCGYGTDCSDESFCDYIHELVKCIPKRKLKFTSIKKDKVNGL